MKPYYDSASRPISPPEEDDPSEPYLDETELPDDSFDLLTSSSTEDNAQVPMELTDPNSEGCSNDTSSSASALSLLVLLEVGPSPRNVQMTSIK